jgi:hypothetical protein
MRPNLVSMFLMVALSLIAVTCYGQKEARNASNEAGTVAAEEIAIDLLIARPVAICSCVIGTGVLVVTLPFTIPSGGVRETAYTFVVQPFKVAFVRPIADQPR